MYVKPKLGIKGFNEVILLFSSLWANIYEKLH